MARRFTSFIKSLKPSKRRKEKPTHDIGPKELRVEECVVCLENERCITTARCNHPICVECLGTYINVTHNSRMPCPCPASAICTQQFTIEDITPYVNETQIGKIWLVQAAKQIESGLGMYCPNQTCSKPILWTTKKLKKSKGAGKCRACNQPICMVCKTIFHHLMSCAEYNKLSPEERNDNDLQLLELAKAKGWRRCPGCQIMVQKSFGCFYMSCNCGTRFCYECGIKLTESRHRCGVRQQRHTLI